MSRHRQKQAIEGGTRNYQSPPRSRAQVLQMPCCPECGSTRQVGRVITEGYGKGRWYHCRGCEVDYSDLGAVCRISPGGTLYPVLEGRA